MAPPNRTGGQQAKTTIQYGIGELPHNTKGRRAGVLKRIADRDAELNRPAAPELSTQKKSKKLSTQKKSKKRKLAEQVVRFHNRAQREKWAIQYPKRVKPTSNGEHLVLSNHTQREGEKLINAIKRKFRHPTKPSAAASNKK